MWCPLVYRTLFPWLQEKGGRGDTVVLQSITRASERWAAGRDKYTIMADFKVRVWIYK